MRDWAKSLVSYRNRFNPDHIVNWMFGSGTTRVQLFLPQVPYFARLCALAPLPEPARAKD